MKTGNQLSGLGPTEIKEYVFSVLPLGEHQRRKESISNAVLGLIEGTQMSVQGIGVALAEAQSLHSKHAIKQVDRLLSNGKFHLPRLWKSWVVSQLGEQKDVTVALDWTDYDADGQSTLSLALSTHKGRALPMMWKTVRKAELKGRRNYFEDLLLTQFRECVPEGVRVTVTADRGFSDQHFFAFMERLNFDYVVRIKGTTRVGQDPNQMRLAHRWLQAGGRCTVLKEVYLTNDFSPIPVFVSVQKKKMKDAWYLVSSRRDWTGAQTVAAYGRRFTIEEMFRDEKNPRFGMGLSETTIRSPARRDRLLFLAALARDLLTVLGAAGESLGLDRMLKANTSKQRTHSLYRQGCHYFRALPRWSNEKQLPLLLRFNDFLLKSPLFQTILGLTPI